MFGKIPNCVFHLPIILIILHLSLIKQMEVERDIALLESLCFLYACVNF